jgi:hypothetical protein
MVTAIKGEFDMTTIHFPDKDRLSKGKVPRNPRLTGIHKEPKASFPQAPRSPCECGCGGFPSSKAGRFLPGHDAKFHAAQKGPKEPIICLCGCGERTKGGRFRPGHDARYHAAQKKAKAEAKVSRRKVRAQVNRKEAA